MICPKCNSGNMEVVNSYSAGVSGKTQRIVCASCGAVITAVFIIVNVDPPRGEGAYSLAKRMKKGPPEERPRA